MANIADSVPSVSSFLDVIKMRGAVCQVTLMHAGVDDTEHRVLVLQFSYLSFKQFQVKGSYSIRTEISGAIGMEHWRRCVLFQISRPVELAYLCIYMRPKWPAE